MRLMMDILRRGEDLWMACSMRILSRAPFVVEDEIDYHSTVILSRNYIIIAANRRRKRRDPGAARSKARYIATSNLHPNPGIYIQPVVNKISFFPSLDILVAL